MRNGHPWVTRNCHCHTVEIKGIISWHPCPLPLKRNLALEHYNNSSHLSSKLSTSTLPVPGLPAKIKCYITTLAGDPRPPCGNHSPGVPDGTPSGCQPQEGLGPKLLSRYPNIMKHKEGPMAPGLVQHGPTVTVPQPRWEITTNIGVHQVQRKLCFG